MSTIREAFSVFDKGVTGDVGKHYFNDAHRQYNEGARELWKRLLGGIDPSKMTADQAKKILEEFKNCPDPRMKALRRELEYRALKQSWKRMMFPPRGID